MAKWEFTEFRSNVPLRILAGDDNGGPMFNRLYSRYNCHLHTAPLWELQQTLSLQVTGFIMFERYS